VAVFGDCDPRGRSRNNVCPVTHLSTSHLLACLGSDRLWLLELDNLVRGIKDQLPHQPLLDLLYWNLISLLWDEHVPGVWNLEGNLSPKTPVNRARMPSSAF
jgi:hypothetical protein